MSFLKRLLGNNERDIMRPLWHAIVGTSREAEWYSEGDAADTVDGRFDMIALVMALVLLRMEASKQLGPKTGLLTELFVADMDRQLRDSGVGDLKVGKTMGLLMEALGGRIGTLREVFAGGDDEALAVVLQRNMRLTTEELPLALAARTRALHHDLAAMPDEALLAGQLRP